ncbi:MAG: Fic family protein [Clostridia bacterium]|nr:Fic family protein [Clostridia bacterium]
MNRAGEYVKNLSGDLEYKSFRPSELPVKVYIDNESELFDSLLRAHKGLAVLNGISSFVPNTDLYISMYVRKEAILSSQIEGTQCTLEDVLDPEVDKNVNSDVSDVVNYIKASQYGIKRLETLPLCLRFFREVHAELLEGVRGEEKNPGEFRRSQNWIGPKNCGLKNARYIPPNVDDMNAALDNLEKYLNSDDELDPIVKAALIHYQFETIHPFLDGNGRVGRLLILFYLLEKQVIDKPVIYISYFLKKNQLEYYDRMSEVRRTGNYEQWINFFATAVARAAEDSIDSIKELVALHEKDYALLPEKKREKDAIHMLFTYIESHPIIDIRKTSDALSLSYNTVSAAVRKLSELGILKETTNSSRNRVFSYEKYLEILRKDI